MSRPIDPERFLVEGGLAVVIPVRIIAWLTRRLRIDQLRVAVRGLDPEVDAVLAACRVAVLSAASSASMARRPELQRPLNRIGTGGAAATLNVTSRAVRRACGEGRLRATKTADGAWQIDREALVEFQATRRRR